MPTEQSDRIKQAKLKAAGYCARGERSPKQVLEKLISYGLDSDEAQAVLHLLREDKFVDSRRFARAFTKDKFRFNKWGRLRIRMELIQHKVSSEIIEEAIYSIDENEYQEMIDSLALQKLAKLRSEQNHLIKKRKTVTFVVGKGFESALVMDRLNHLLSSPKQS